MNETELKKFKNLLEYFVSHLDYIENKDVNAPGYDEYIKSYVESQMFKMTGQGYDGAAIQNQIKEWDTYESGQICINVQGNYGTYKSTKCYLNWIHTGINIIAKWKDTKIVALYQDEFNYWEKPPRRVNTGKEYSLSDLGLFSSASATAFLRTFAESYVERHENLKKAEKIKSQMKNIYKATDLLLYKKQIILQGPPGTGKTRLAKEIAENIIVKKGINDINIKKWIIVGSIIQSAKGTAQYKVKDISDRKVILERGNETLGETSFDKIIECFNEEGWKNEIKDNDRRRTAAIAKFIHDKNDVTNNDQIKLLQFHPSYTYEDFVRGIVAKSNGKEIEYKNVNKTLGLFAKDALANFNASTSASPEAMAEAWVDEKFELFKKDIEAKLPEEELVLSGDITIFQVSDSHFKYAEKWKTPGYLNYEEFKKLVKAILNGELDLANKQVDKEKFIHAHYRYTYYNALLKLFFDEYSFEKETPKLDAKNYVLVIDEINRANLSSVLGELIYALEYRGEEVESMYEVDGSQKLILPPNLYIIGTMNTADRSVGHIDYAIKRRFAFVDVLPKVLENSDEMIFNKELFEKVSRLFITNLEEYKANPSEKLKRAKTLSPEFRPEDIWLGHSYFIQKKENNENGNEILVPQNFSMRLEYEIKPILQEYVKDGVLIGSVTITEGGQESEIPVDQYIHSL